LSIKKEFKILSLDGGGIRGLYTAKILENFEDQFKCNIVDYFDLICGTSTGGLIALALSIRTPAKEIVNFYRKYSKVIFYKSMFSGLKQLASGGKYDNIGLSKVLSEIFQDKLIGDSECLLCIPSFSITDGRPYIFKFDHPPLSRDNRTKYIDVALATSAAPTFFPLVQIKEQSNKQFIDGGVYSNNPTYIGFTEAVQYFVGEGKDFNKLNILSVSTIEAPIGKSMNEKPNKAIIDWKNDLIKPFMVGQSFTIDFSMKKFADAGLLGLNYIRIGSPEISCDQIQLVDLDNSTDEALDFLEGKGNDQGLIYRKMSEIQHFFNEPKKYKIK
jgi:uncharacterized protein